VARETGVGFTHNKVGFRMGCRVQQCRLGLWLHGCLCCFVIHSPAQVLPMATCMMLCLATVSTAGDCGPTGGEVAAAGVGHE
jgi:hypothetical protein